MGRTIHEAERGRILLGDSLAEIPALANGSVSLIVTSPPYALVSPKEYGNESAEKWLDWFRPFAAEFFRLLADNGSLVVDIGGSWNKGTPTRNLSHLRLPLMLCDDFGFHLAQEFYWYNPTKLPTPTMWTARRRVRLKDAVNNIWWLSKTPWPKAGNRRVLQPYSIYMERLIEKDKTEKEIRPSGHVIVPARFAHNEGSIPPNLLVMPNSDCTSYYFRQCKRAGLKTHPARFPAEIPEFFVRMLTDTGDLVIDPFAGSCVTGEVCERLHRRWLCIEQVEEYCEGGRLRFTGSPVPMKSSTEYYRLPRPGLMWADNGTIPLFGEDELGDGRD